MDEFDKAVDTERGRQDKKWGGARHDDRHRPNDWVAFICREASKATAEGWKIPDFQKQMVQVAALAKAAWEASERANEKAWLEILGGAAPGGR